MKNKRQFYMGIAAEAARASYCEKNKVGAVIEKNGNIIAFGYNGTPTGFDNCCEIDENTTKPEVLHAESNAIAKCAKHGISCLESTMYVTTSPCIECAKLIIQAGISKVYYVIEYRDKSGIELLEKALIYTEQI